jgi:hypothetical protein
MGVEEREGCSRWQGQAARVRKSVQTPGTGHHSLP